MKRMEKRALWSAPLVVFVLACSASPRAVEDYSKTTEKPSGLFFRYEEVPDLSVPSEVGLLDGDNSLRDTLRAIFAEAYAEALLRGLPMTGVLGSDRVHQWPSASPAAWSQNFASSDETPNIWGLPGFVLALSDLENPSAAYLVSGELLGAYGKSAGHNGENGAAGYGVPRESGRFEDGAAAQYFSRGTIRTGRSGSAFIPASPFETAEDEFTGRDVSAEVGVLFANHCEAVFALRTWYGDGPIERVVFARPWIIAGAVPYEISGLYLKTCNGGKDAFVLLEQSSSQTIKLPVRVRHISAPILNALIHSSTPIPGIKRESPLGHGGASSYARALIGGFAVYGLPLSDMVPLRATETRQNEAEGAEQPVNAGGETPALFQAAQRFSRGWIIAEVRPERLSEAEGPLEPPRSAGPLPAIEAAPVSGTQTSERPLPGTEVPGSLEPEPDPPEPVPPEPVDPWAVP